MPLISRYAVFRIGAPLISGVILITCSRVSKKTKTKKLKIALKTFLFVSIFTLCTNRINEKYCDNMQYQPNNILLCCNRDDSAGDTAIDIRIVHEYSGSLSSGFPSDNPDDNDPNDDGRNTPEFLEFVKKLDGLMEYYNFLPQYPYPRFTDLGKHYLTYTRLLELARNPESKKFTPEAMDQALVLSEYEFRGITINTRRVKSKLRSRNISFVVQWKASKKKFYLSADLAIVDKNGRLLDEDDMGGF